MQIVGIVHSGHPGKHDSHIKALQDGLKQATSTMVHYPPVRYAQDGDPTAQFQLSIDQDHATLLIAAGGTACANAAVGPSTHHVPIIPVVFTSIAEPARPAPNMTGICARTSEHDVTRLDLLNEALPDANKFGVLYNPKRDNWATQWAALQAEAGDLGLTLDPQPIDATLATTVEVQIQAAFQVWVTSGDIDGVLVVADPVFNNHRGSSGLISIANASGIPTIYQWREFAEEGGFMSYGPNLTVAYKLAGIYMGRIVDDRTKINLEPLSLDNFELVINLKTAKSLKVDKTIPDTLLARADHLIVPDLP